MIWFVDKGLRSLVGGSLMSKAVDGELQDWAKTLPDDCRPERSSKVIYSYVWAVSQGFKEEEGTAHLPVIKTVHAASFDSYWEFKSW